MEQHPVPQNVTTFQFKLIGDITLKQFAYVAAGIILGYVLYQITLIPSLIRLPLALFSALLGFGLAFFPIEERPMDRWLINFFRSIYAPTQYVWRKSNTVPEVLAQLQTMQAAPVPQPPAPVPQPMVAPIPRGPITGVKPPPPPPKPIETKPEPVRPAPPPLKIEPPPKKPDGWTVGAPPLKKPTFRISPAPSVKSITGEKLELNKPAPVAVAAKTDTKQVEKMKQNYEALEKRLQQQMVAMQSEMQKGNVTKERFMQLQQLLTQLLAEKDRMGRELDMLRRQLDEERKSETVRPSEYKQMPKESSSVKIVAPNIARSVGVPQMTTYPNVVTGIIKDSQGSLLPDIILTIKDREGLPVRALKSNKIGQFAASTPLSNGTYVIEVEDPKKRYRFDRIEITLSNQVLPPLEISATSERDLQRAKLSAEIFGKNTI